MQTQSIQSQQPNKTQPPKSAPLPNNDFKQALTLEIERMPVCAAPEQQAPQAATQSKSQLKNAQGAKPAQNAGKAEQSGQADAAEPPAQASEAAAAEGKPAVDEGSTAEDKAETGDEPPADPAAGLLAMLAAYGQLTSKAEPKAEAPASAGTDAAALAALQADSADKGATLADLAADARAAKGEAGSTGLQDALADGAEGGAARLLKAGTDAALGAERKAESFAAQLADATPALQPVAPPAAQALAGAMQAANAVAANALQARVGSNAWEQQLGQKVVWMVAGGDQSASLTLNPPDLGPLQVVLNVSNDSATATFTAHQPETRQAIENALPKLREMMSEAGIALGNATVSAGSQEQQQAFAEQARGGGGRGRHGNGGDAGGPDEAQPVIRRTVLGAVDTFA